MAHVYLARMEQHLDAPLWMDRWVVGQMRDAPYVYMAMMKQHLYTPLWMDGWVVG